MRTAIQASGGLLPDWVPKDGERPSPRWCFLVGQQDTEMVSVWLGARGKDSRVTTEKGCGLEGHGACLTVLPGRIKDLVCLQTDRAFHRRPCALL